MNKLVCLFLLTATIFGKSHLSTKLNTPVAPAPAPRHLPAQRNVRNVRHLPRLHRLATAQTVRPFPLRRRPVVVQPQLVLRALRAHRERALAVQPVHARDGAPPVFAPVALPVLLVLLLVLDVHVLAVGAHGDALAGFVLFALRAGLAVGAGGRLGLGVCGGLARLEAGGFLGVAEAQVEEGVLFLGGLERAVAFAFEVDGDLAADAEFGGFLLGELVELGGLEFEVFFVLAGDEVGGGELEEVALGAGGVLGLVAVGVVPGKST